MMLVRIITESGQAAELAYFQNIFGLNAPVATKLDELRQAASPAPFDSTYSGIRWRIIPEPFGAAQAFCASATPWRQHRPCLCTA